MERGVLQGLAAFRWGAWLWMATVLLVSREDLEHAWLALGLAVLALTVTAADTALLRTNCEALLRPGPVLVELAVGGALVLADGVAYGPDHAFSRWRGGMDSWASRNRERLRRPHRGR